jgi:hypothetical protein
LMALLVPISILLAEQGVIQPTRVVEDDNFQRILSGTNWSSLGLYSAIISASLGGLWLVSHARNLFMRLIVAVTLVAVGAVGFSLTAQRAAAIVYFVCLALSAGIFIVRVPTLSRSRRILAVIGVAAILLALYQFSGETTASSLIYRMNNLNEGGEGGAAALPTAMHTVFFDDLGSSFYLFAPGGYAAYLQVGAYAHFILGEAYYDGGVLLMLTLIIGFVKSGWLLWRNLRDVQDPDGVRVVAVLAVIFVGFCISLSIQPGLNIRVLPMLLGMWLSLAHHPAEQPTADIAQSAPLSRRQRAVVAKP